MYLVTLKIREKWEKFWDALILKKIRDPQIHRGLSSINKTKKYKYLTPFHNLEGMTANISVLFPEQNVDLTDLYTKFICFSTWYICVLR
jgi:hypothetical protein